MHPIEGSAGIRERYHPALYMVGYNVQAHPCLTLVEVGLRLAKVASILGVQKIDSLSLYSASIFWFKHFSCVYCQRLGELPYERFCVLASG